MYRFFILFFLMLFSYSLCAEDIIEDSLPIDSVSENILISNSNSSAFSHSSLSTESSEDDFDEFDLAPPPALPVKDPFEKYNRAMFAINYSLYKTVLLPVSKGYAAVLPRPVRSSVGNFFKNLYFPVRFANNLLQGKFKSGGIELQRFVINTTLGMGGLFDPAYSLFKLEPKPEDFGQTLGHWGVPSGPYLVMPFFGPSNLRDAFSDVPNYVLTPTSYLQTSSQVIEARALQHLNTFSMDPEAFKRLKNSSVDFYIFARESATKLRLDEISK